MDKQNKVGTAASSANLQRSGKPRTSKTSKLIPEAALEILTQAFRLVQETGVSLDVGVTDDGNGVTVTLRDTKLQDGVLVPVTPNRA